MIVINIYIPIMQQIIYHLKTVKINEQVELPHQNKSMYWVDMYLKKTQRNKEK
jgi:hypothetical protein